MITGMIMFAVMCLVFFGYLGWFAFSSWSGRFTRSRTEGIVRLVECAVLMLMARLLIAWGTVPVVWFVAVGIIAVGSVGLAARWSALPWLRPDRRWGRTTAAAATRVGFAGLIAGLLLV
jgi:hypothetical protein